MKQSRLPHHRSLDDSVAIVGTMGVGKTTLFEMLCPRSARQQPVVVPETSTKVEAGVLRMGLSSPLPRETLVLDLPRIYTLLSQNEDEMAVRHLLLKWRPRCILQLLDAKNLRRSLVLALQLAELGLPMSFLVNMMDEAETRGIQVSVQGLQVRLGAEVRWSVLSEGQGLDEVPALLRKSRVPRKRVRFPRPVEEALEQLEPILEGTKVPARALAILLLGRSPQVAQYVVDRFGHDVAQQADEIVSALQRRMAQPLEVVITESYFAEADRIVADVQRVHQQSSRLLVDLGRYAQRLSTGIPMALGVLVAMYFWVGTIGATMLVDLLNNKVFHGVLIPWFKQLVEPIPSDFVRAALVDDNFGVLTTGVFLAFGIVLPVLFCFYLFFGFLEESGYLPRFAVLLNRALQRIGLNGKGLIPLVMGLSCVTMALLTTRVLDTRKERIIASLLLVLIVPCAPLLGMIMVILGPMPWYASVFVFGVLALQVLLVGTLARRLLPGLQPEMILELPPMRLPKLRTLVRRSWWRTYYFLREAVPVFMAASFFVFLFDYVGGLDAVEAWSQPVVQGWLGLPEESVRVFIKTAIRRENGATELQLLKDHFTSLQLVVTLLAMVLMIPCVNSVIVLIRERGAPVATAIIGAVFAYALLVAGAANHLLRALEVSFG
jgi:ferrous iron transport protein B